jgi:hypothetical protein
MSAARQHGQSLAARLGPDGWLQHWASIHESGHATVARYLGLPVSHATLNHVRIPHSEYRQFDDSASIARLVISAAGDASTTVFLGYTDTGRRDTARSKARLRELGADDHQMFDLMSDARRRAERLVIELRLEIECIAAALRDRQVLTQAEIDVAIRVARSGIRV